MDIDDHPVIQAIFRVRQRNAGNFSAPGSICEARDSAILEVYREVRAELEKAKHAPRSKAPPTDVRELASRSSE